MAPVPLLVFCKVFAYLTAWEKRSAQKRLLTGKSWGRGETAKIL